MTFATLQNSDENTAAMTRWVSPTYTATPHSYAATQPHTSGADKQPNL